jgi:hypothetical protein
MRQGEGEVVRVYVCVRVVEGEDVYVHGEDDGVDADDADVDVNVDSADDAMPTRQTGAGAGVAPVHPTNRVRPLLLLVGDGGHLLEERDKGRERRTVGGGQRKWRRG